MSYLGNVFLKLRTPRGGPPYVAIGSMTITSKCVESGSHTPRVVECTCEVLDELPKLLCDGLRKSYGEISEYNKKMQADCAAVTGGLPE